MFYKNTYYQWKLKFKLFNWKSILSNNKTLSNTIYLREYYETYLYSNKNEII